MAQTQTISKIGIKNSTGTGYDTRDIAAKGQNVEIGYDADGQIILDVDTATAATTKPLTQTLQELSSGAGDEKADNYHAWTDSDIGVDHGKATTTQYGHMKVGTGLTASNGTVSVSYGTGAGTAAAGNDARLSNARKNPNAVTFTTGAGDAAGSYDGTSTKTVGYTTVGAAPAGHTSISASSSTLGHVKTGTGLTNSSGTISVTYGTAAGTACVGNDSRLSDSRTPKAHATTSTTYGGGTANTYGHVKLVDTYSVDIPSAADNGAATSIAASAYALQQAYSTLNSKINQNEYKDITSDYTSGTFSNNLSKYNPGNYIKRTYNGTTYVMVLADYNYFYSPYGQWGALLSKPHWVAIVLGFSKGQMNSSNTTAGGFAGSAMYTWLQGDCLTVIKNIASGHYLENQRLISDGTYNSSSSETHGFGWEWQTMAACLMSEVQVYGSKCWSDLGWSCGEANRQLDVFRNDSFINVLGRDYGQGGDKLGGSSCWLRDISACSPGAHFCIADADGAAHSWGASTSYGRYPIINLY